MDERVLEKQRTHTHTSHVITNTHRENNNKKKRITHTNETNTHPFRHTVVFVNCKYKKQGKSSLCHTLKTTHTHSTHTVVEKNKISVIPLNKTRHNT